MKLLLETHTKVNKMYTYLSEWGYPYVYPSRSTFSSLYIIFLFYNRVASCDNIIPSGNVLLHRCLHLQSVCISNAKKWYYPKKLGTSGDDISMEKNNRWADSDLGGRG